MLLDEDQRAFLLPRADACFVAFCLSVLENDLVIRIDLPEDAVFALASPTFVRTPEDLDAVMTVLRMESTNDLLYPMSVWVFPPNRFDAATKLIEAFQCRRADGQLFTDILAMGGSRLAVFQYTFDLSIHCEKLDWGIDVIARAAQSLRGRVEWAGETPEELRARHVLS